jgi:hypothetical protein
MVRARNLCPSSFAIMTIAAIVHCSNTSSPPGGSADASSEGARNVTLQCDILGGLTKMDAGICTYPATVCCQGSAENGCKPASQCQVLAWSCAGSDDCSNGDQCCMAVQKATGAGTISCQAGSSCPSTGLLHAQICKTSADCRNGALCITYECGGVFFPLMCEGTLGGLGMNQCNVYVADAGAATDSDSSGAHADSGNTD